MQRSSRGVSARAYLVLLFVVLLLASRQFLRELSAGRHVFSTHDDAKPFNFSPRTLLQPKQRVGVDVLVLVNTISAERDLRRQIRSSWANVTDDVAATLRVEFFMGRPPNEHVERILHEHQTYDDLVVVDVHDSYYNLSLKTLTMLDYKQHKYSKAKCLVKADIDNVLILRNYVRLCEETVAPLILGKCDVKRTVFRDNSKWAVPEFVYPHTQYPPYCSTGTYVLAGILAERIGVRRRHIGAMTFSEVPEFLCRNGFLHTYSIHMSRDKNPAKHLKKLLKLEGSRCWW